MEESKYLGFVEEKLKERIAALDDELEETERDVESMHDYFWENYTEMDEYGYENFDNQQALLQQVNSNRTLQELRRRFCKMQDSPYFGRVDFRYEGDDCSEKHYIGIFNFAEHDGGMPLVFDWRAPVSGLFYDFEKGPAFYEAPRGKITGEVTAKWQYKIRNGQMIYAVESDLKIDDDILRQELSANGDIQLKNIVRTIQKEQNQIIRNTKDRILVVQGAAGSGKTSIALHRVAYLLYHDRKYLKANEVLILSPNRIFSNYISHILPELGEENICEMSFDFFAWKELRAFAGDCEDRYDEIEKELANDREEKEKFALRTSYKQSKEFAKEIDGFILLQEDELVCIRDIHFKKLEKTAAELTHLFYYKFWNIPLYRRMEAVMEYVVDETETLTGKDFDEEEKAKIAELFNRMYETRDLYELYNRFLKHMNLPLLPDRKAENRVIPYEDVYPMLYMKYCLEGVSSMKRVKHLIVDEMQDYSYLQYLILAKLFPNSKMTIVGDCCQTIGARKQDVMKFLPSVLGKDIRMVSINKSYRNTLEIAAFAQALIGETQIENLGRHGKEPEVHFVNGIEDAVSIILNALKLEGMTNKEEAAKEIEAKYSGQTQYSGEVEYDGKTEHNVQRLYETAAVICMTKDDAENVYQSLKRALNEKGVDTEKRLTLLQKESEEFRAGIVVTAFYLAKGLEFDQVFCICDGVTAGTKSSSTKKDSPLMRQAKYISATRALHELDFIVRCEDDV